MNIFKEKIEKIVKETIEFQVCNCIKCNNSQVSIKPDFDKKAKPIELFNHDHGSYYVSGGTCHKCGSTFTEKRGKWKQEAAYIWNKHNDVEALIVDQQIIIKIANDEIERLKIIKEDRKKVNIESN